MIKYTITPIRTMRKRGWEYARGKRHDYLEKLSRFSKYVTLLIRDGLGAKFTTEEISKKHYLDIAAILKKKDVESIKFDISYCNGSLPLKKTDRIIAASVRAIIRHLATHGIQKDTQNGHIKYRLRGDKWLRSDFTIETSKEFLVTVKLALTRLIAPRK